MPSNKTHLFGLASSLAIATLSSGALAQTTDAGADAPAAQAEEAPAAAAEKEADGSSEVTAKNTIYLELLGPGLLYSLNYERDLVAQFNVRVGFGGASWGGQGYVQVPVGFSYTGIGGSKHHLELGATANLTHAFSSVDSATAVTFSPIIGYRRQPAGGGFNFRAGLSPIVAGAGEGVVAAGFLPWPYVSFGASF